MVLCVLVEVVEAHVGDSIVGLFPPPGVTHVAALSDLMAGIQVEDVFVDGLCSFVALFGLNALLLLLLAAIKQCFLALLGVFLYAV